VWPYTLLAQVTAANIFVQSSLEFRTTGEGEHVLAIFQDTIVKTKVGSANDSQEVL
jgi:hypothetical protein